MNQEIRRDVFTSQEEAEDRAEEIGCEGFHTHNEDGQVIYSSCRTHEEYSRLTGEELKQIDLKPTQGMAEEAKRALEWRKEFNRGGTAVGVARANQLVNRENLSERTVLRMYSFFSRHEVDKQAEGFSQGEKGYPSAGRIAWGLWGGDAGFTWSTKKREQINKEMKSWDCQDNEEKAVSGKIRKALEKKVKDHNDKHGDKKGKRVTVGMLGKVFVRGVGAYRTNPQSVRPNVTGPDQWGLARVNAFLFAVRSGRFRSGQFDRDLLPKDHPLYRAKKKTKSNVF